MGVSSVLPPGWRGATFGDVVAGATVAATSLPQYIAYAELAGLSGLRGVQTSWQPLLAFAFVTRSSTLSVGVTSITAIMASAALGGAEYKELHGEDAWAQLLGAFSVLVGVASWVLAACGATRLVAYIPGAVRTGWKLGFAITVVASQAAGALFGAGAGFVKSQCGVPAGVTGGAAAMYRLLWMSTHPHAWDAATVALSALTMVLVLRGRALLGRAARLASGGRVTQPIAGLEVVLATVVGACAAALFGYSGSVVGRLPSAGARKSAGALSMLGADEVLDWVRQWPWEMPWGTLIERLGGVPWAAVAALAFTVVDFLAIISVVDASDAPLACELVGQGLGCLVSGIAGSAPIGGSLSRSLVAKLTGAASPVAGFVGGLTTLALAAPSVSALLSGIPKAVLSAVVLVAVLPGVIFPRDMLKLRGREALVAWSTAGACAFADPTTGFGVGLAVAVALQPARFGVGLSAAFFAKKTA